MENFFSRLTLDIIGKAVFNYDFDSLSTDDPFIQAVYTALREAEYRSTAFVPYWKLAPLRWLVPRQRACGEALVVINATLDGLIEKCQKLVSEEGERGGRTGVGVVIVKPRPPPPPPPIRSTPTTNSLRKSSCPPRTPPSSTSCWPAATKSRPSSCATT